MTNRIEVKASLNVDDTGKITGIAWPFASPDRVGDIIVKGAFADTSEKLPMLWAHDQSQAVGVWDSITESGKGLQVKGRLLVNDVQRAAEVRALVQAGAVTGLSIGFETKKSTSRKGGGRTIYKLDLLEISIVAVPAHPGAQITSIKGNHMEDENIAPDYAAIETKLASLENDLKSFNAVVNRLDKIETRLNRPGVGGGNPQLETKELAELEAKAFDSFIRLGIERMPQHEIKSLTASTGTSGGYTVSPTYLNEIQKNLVLYSAIRPLARVMTVGTTPVLLPKRSAIGSGSWVDEGSPSPAAQSTYDQQSFGVYEFAAHSDVSNRLLEDSTFSVESLIAEDLGLIFGQSESQAFLYGDGVGKPSGLLLNTDVPTIPGVHSLAPVTANLLIEMLYSLPTAYAQNAVWGMSRSMAGYVRQLTNSVGTFLWQDGPGGGLANGQPATLLGKPVVEFPELPGPTKADGTALDVGTIPIVLGDFKQGYRIFDRVGITIQRDPYTQQANSIIRFNGRRRVGGGVNNTAAFRFLKIAA